MTLPARSTQVAAGFRLTKFVIVESLEEHEAKTGQVLAQLLTSLVVQHQLQLPVEYRVCNNVVAFREFLQELTSEAEKQGHAPILHVECHGDKEGGLEFANGSRMNWPELAGRLTDLNIASQFNLLTIVSACFGGYLLSQVTAMKPAPCWCIVAPTDTIDSAEAMRGFRIFYGVLLKLQDAGKASLALQRDPLTEGEWFSQLAQLWFERLTMEYVKTHCTIEATRSRAIRLYRRARREGKTGSVGGFVRRLRNKHREALTGSHFDIFFCTDRIPSAAERFEPFRKRIAQQLAALRGSKLYEI